MKILVFPDSVAGSQDDLQMFRNLGLEVLAARSSSMNAESQVEGSLWLPFIEDDLFVEKLRELTEIQSITHIYTRHLPTFVFLQSLSSAFGLPEIIGASPITRETNRTNDALNRAQGILAELSAHYPGTTSPDVLHVASLLLTASTIYGECSEAKIVALSAIMPSLPVGDIVEIGVLFGKSAWVLDRLSEEYQKGPVISVDAWNAQDALQLESPEFLQNLVRLWDWQKIFEGFVLSTRATSRRGKFNYIRAHSIVAREVYLECDVLSTEEFGSTHTNGRIALLHIDANHDTESVWNDVSNWSSLVAPGGWIVLDDVDWKLGRGPRAALNRLWDEQPLPVSYWFVFGGAAFLQLGE